MDSATFSRASVPRTSTGGHRVSSCPQTRLPHALAHRALSRRSLATAAVSMLLPFLLIAVDPAQASVPLPKPRPAVAPQKHKTPTVKANAAKPAATAPLPRQKPSYRPAWAVPTKEARVYGPAFKLAAAGGWTKLSKRPRSPRDPALENVLEWLRLEHHGAKTSFTEIAAFLDDHPVWPRRSRLIQRAELRLGDDIANPVKLDWFKKHPPTTTTGRLKWIAALGGGGDRQGTEDAVRDTWRHARFSKTEQRRFQRKHRVLLGPADHWRRLDRFLWLGARGAARAMMPLVSADRRKLAEARIRLRGMSGGVDGAVKRVPVKLMSDPGLIYERLRWRHRKGLKDEALELLWDIPNDLEFWSIWWKERSRQVRYALDSGRHEDAYLLAASHIQRSGGTFAEAQWHAGWIALRYRDKPAEAARYFTSMHAAVKTPISRARAAYWAGRALEASGGMTAARRWYAAAGRHQTTFYGQLAALKSPSTIARLPSPPTPDAVIRTSPETRDLINSAVALGKIGRERMARLFFRTAARAARTREDAVWIATSARALGYVDMAVYTARVAARSGFILTEAGYPLIQVPVDGAPEPALVLAVIRQESGFDDAARSRVGALGLMQLMPATARNVARGLKIPYGRGRLTADPAYNLRLGSSYLRAQIKAFSGEYVLALAAYNAGPHRVKRWLRERGDPRLPGVDMIDWIERIPFAETRNYVQRVLESLHVYRLRLGSPETGWRMANASPNGIQCASKARQQLGCAVIKTARAP
jgi:soluble lytic murein transglycosylase